MADGQNASPAEPVEPVWDQDRPRRDELRGSGTSGGPSVISGGDGWMFVSIAAVSVAIGVVNALSAAQEAAWHGGSYDILRRLFWEMSSVGVILMLLPLLVRAVRQIRRTAGLFVRAAIGLATLFGFSALHIAGMISLRKFALWLAGGSYEFNLSWATAQYEFRKDALAAFLIASTLWLLESRRELKQAAAANASSAGRTAGQSQHTDLIWLRDGANRIRVAPREILWVASAGNYIEYSLSGGTRHLIRGTLGTAEGELSRFGVVRIHRTKLANLARVTGIDLKASGDFELTFDNGQTLAGSRRYRNAVASLGGRVAPS